MSVSTLGFDVRSPAPTFMSFRRVNRFLDVIHRQREGAGIVDEAYVLHSTGSVDLRRTFAMAQRNGPKKTDRGRHAETGEFVPAEKARERADTTTAETVKKRRGQTEPARRNEKAEK